MTCPLAHRRPGVESCRALLPYHNVGCVNPTREWIICDDILGDDHLMNDPVKRAAALEWWNSLPRNRKE